ncbi:MAG: carbon-nitrogen family hydrolase [Candidatus Heimdallarchaeota archaeon]|nr:carbon-nitrogen family hydrolase [Candidatus Heimdallarchaeota archaeon]
MKDITVAAYQMDILFARKEENLKKIKDTIQLNHRSEIDLWILPELFSTGFAYSHFSGLAEDLSDSYTLKFLEKLAQEFNTNIAGSFLVKDKKINAFRNLGFILTPTKELVYQYYKIHLWGQEKSHFTPGTDVSEPINLNNKAMIGMSICYDLRFPEVARQLVLNGAEVLITTAAWPSARIHHFNLLAAARALENTSYHIALNRLGSDLEPTLVKYSGSSRIIDPLGNIIAGAGNFEEVMIARLKSDVLENTRNIIPVLKDRKINF